MPGNIPEISAMVPHYVFWVVEGVPVPVRYQFPNKYLDDVEPFQSNELECRGIRQKGSFVALDKILSLEKKYLNKNYQCTHGQTPGT